MCLHISQFLFHLKRRGNHIATNIGIFSSYSNEKKFKWSKLSAEEIADKYTNATNTMSEALIEKHDNEARVKGVKAADTITKAVTDSLHKNITVIINYFIWHYIYYTYNEYYFAFRHMTCALAGGFRQ